MQRALTPPAGPTHPRAAAGPLLQEQAAGRSTLETPAACDAAASVCNDATACVNDALCRDPLYKPRDVLRRRVAHAAINTNAPMLRHVNAAAGILFTISLRAIELRAALDAKRMVVKQRAVWDDMTWARRRAVFH
jgi:hypothetical protein